MSTKYIFVTGGVVSGLGKGITAAALGALMKARGLSVITQKFDPYINVDPALMSPIQHGEKFITEDGAEMDLDIGHYERFTDVSLSVESDITSGKIYQEVIQKERAGYYNGGTVQVVPHIINEIKDHMFRVSRKNGQNVDVVIVEIGGTVGDMESTPYIEAMRQISYKVGRENCLFIHVTLLPYLNNPGELKTKPTQHSVLKMLSFGVQPDILVLRSEHPIDDATKHKVASFCNVKFENVIENLDMPTVYYLPLYFEKQGFAQAVCNQLGIAQFVEPDLSSWKLLNEQILYATKKIKIALVGKYVAMQDAYLSSVEALMHASIRKGADPEIVWIDSDSLEDREEAELSEVFAGIDAMLIPGGFGPRGMEGMITAASYARKNRIPFLGLGLGMQMAVVEVARNLAGIKDAHTDECEKECSDIFYYAALTEEEKNHLEEISLTNRPIRLGAYPMKIAKDSRLFKIYKTEQASERHHHRREFNLTWQGPLLEAGLVFSGTSPDGSLIEAVEYPDHPFYIGLISHPEFKSRPTRPHPLFEAFIEAAIDYNKKRN